MNEKIIQLYKLKMKEVQKGLYELEEDFTVLVGRCAITAPKGMLTDLASVPLVLQPLFPKDGKWTPAAVIHDFLYSSYNHTGINKQWADKIFLKLMEQYGIPLRKRLPMYCAVAMFGEPCCKSNTGYYKQAVIDHTEDAVAYNKQMEDLLGI